MALGNIAHLADGIDRDKRRRVGFAHEIHQLQIFVLVNDGVDLPMHRAVEGADAVVKSGTAVFIQKIPVFKTGIFIRCGFPEGCYRLRMNASYIVEKNS